MDPSWEIQDEFDFSRLSKLQFDVRGVAALVRVFWLTFLKAGAGEELVATGSLGYFDKSLDRVSTRGAKSLPPTTRTFLSPTTIDDQIIRKVRVPCIRD